MIAMILRRVATSQLDLNSLTFPDFFGALFPDLTTQIWWVSRGIPSEARKSSAPATTGFLHKYALKSGTNFGLPQPDHFPWLSLTLDKKYWNSLTSPDFPEGQSFPWFPLIFPDGGNPASGLRKMHYQLVESLSHIYFTLFSEPE